MFVPSGHLIYTDRSVLFAVPFDPDKLEIRGTAVPVLDDIEPDGLGFGDVSVSRNGTVVHRRASGAMAEHRRLAGCHGQKTGAAHQARSVFQSALLAGRQALGDAGSRTVGSECLGLRSGAGGPDPARQQWRHPDGSRLEPRWQLCHFWGPRNSYDGVRSDASGQPKPLLENSTSHPAPLPWSFTADGKTLARHSG